MTLTAPPFGDRILVLSPHPDDEVVGCAAAIGRARAAGARAAVLHLSDGVPPRETQWPWRRAGHSARVAKRRAEAEAAAEALGIRLIGILDGGSRTLRRRLLAAFATVRAAVAEGDADAVWVPAWEGAHADHDAANALGAALRRVAPDLAVWEYAAYNNAGGRTNSQRFPAGVGAETTIDLTPAEAAAKAELLRGYGSEAANLRHIGVARESFRPLPDHDYTRPPHAGRLFYERFHWVPFRHPRIDFTRSAEVSAAIAAFFDGL